jgi:hypothetical protein
MGTETEIETENSMREGDAETTVVVVAESR